MKYYSKSKLKLYCIIIFLFFMVLTATQVSAAEKVQLEGTIQGAKCTHFKVKCYNDDNHIALEPDFVLVVPSGEYYFMPNLPRDVKISNMHTKKFVFTVNCKTRNCGLITWSIWMPADPDLKPPGVGRTDLIFGKLNNNRERNRFM